MARTNILLITSDQQHWDTIGKTNPRIQTPALDRLCDEGTRFNRAYCSSPVCSPSRATLITGLYPSHHHCWTIGVKLPEDVPTVGDAFQENGYESILVGKAHFQPLSSQPGSESIECQPILRDLDFWQGFHGPWYGFNHVETGRMHGHESHAGQHYAIWMKEKGLEDWQDYFIQYPSTSDEKYRGPEFSGATTTWDLPDEYHHSTWIGERSVANIEECVAEDKPFFLWASFFDPHPPYIIHEPWASMYDPANMTPGAFVDGEFDNMPPAHRKTRETKPDYSEFNEAGGHALHGYSSHRHEYEPLQQKMACYYGMTSLMDREIGRILDSLDRLGIADNTLVVFTSDHGHFLGQHGLIAKGAFHYEDMVKVPMIARWPGHIPANVESDSLQSLIDYAPTFLAAADIDVPGLMQGRNQLDVWSGNTTAVPRRNVLVENRHNPSTVHLKTYVDARYKLTVYRGREYGELFDLQEDPDEVSNKWDDPTYAQVKSELLLNLVQSELAEEPTRMPRIAGA